MSYQQTSLEAYHSIKELGQKQQAVYNCLKSLECANNTIIAKKLGWSINRVTPRVLELRNKRLVRAKDMRECPITKRMSIFWEIA